MHFDTDLDPNKPANLDLIAQWAKEVGDEAESHALELKSTLDFTTKAEAKKSRAKIVKFIIGVANRDEHKAAKHFNGYGIMLIGISKDEVHGVEAIPEQHEFHNATKSFFGPAVPTYTFKMHIFEGRNLLFVLVDPPTNGKEIYICSDSYYSSDPKERKDSLFDGAIYYRDSTETKPADSTQIREMITRLQGGNYRAQVGISGIVADPSAITPESIEAFYRAKAKEAEEDALAEIEDNERQYSHGLFPEIRFSIHEYTPEQRLSAARDYLTNARDCMVRLFELTLPTITLEISNQGTQPLNNPTIEFTFPSPVRFYQADLQNQPEDVHPSEIWPHHTGPTPFEASRYLVSVPQKQATITSGHEYGDEHSFRWKPGQISPGEKTATFDEPISIFINSEVPATAKWKLTDPNLRAPLFGEITIDVEKIVSIEALYILQTYGRRLGEGTATA